MARIQWDKVDERPYETGVDHGLLNLDDLTVPWNGLVSIDELEILRTELITQFDGRPYSNLQFGGLYQAKVKAYSFPDGMGKVLGLLDVLPGFFLTNQRRPPFNFSYRTMMNETEYKIHLVHDATLTRSRVTYATMTEKIKINEGSWVIDAVPPKSSTHTPTAHIVVNSIKTDSAVLSELEDLLYGTSSTDPYFPTQSELIDLFN
jgi:hypothetical protein